MNAYEKLSKAAADFLAGLPVEMREEYRQYLHRFVRWCGSDRPVGNIEALEVSNYAESVNTGSTDIVKILTPVRAFLSYAKKQDLTETNLSVHLNIKKTSGRRSKPAMKRPETIEMTVEGYEELVTELESLKKERPKMSEDIRIAAADKDFRENAPLEAARERQGMVESRIRQLEAMLKTSKPGGGKPAGQAVAPGSTVIIQDLSDNDTMCYTLVNPNEASPVKGKLSVVSPIGRALLGRKEGDEVQVAAPAGTSSYKIIRIEC